MAGCIIMDVVGRRDFNRLILYFYTCAKRHWTVSLTNAQGINICLSIDRHSVPSLHTKTTYKTGQTPKAIPTRTDITMGVKRPPIALMCDAAFDLGKRIIGTGGAMRRREK